MHFHQLEIGSCDVSGESDVCVGGAEVGAALLAKLTNVKGQSKEADVSQPGHRVTDRNLI